MLSNFACPRACASLHHSRLTFCCRLPSSTVLMLCFPMLHALCETKQRVIFCSVNCFQSAFPRGAAWVMTLSSPSVVSVLSITSYCRISHCCAFKLLQRPRAHAGIVTDKLRCCSCLLRYLFVVRGITLVLEIQQHRSSPCPPAFVTTLHLRPPSSPLCT